MKNIFVAVTIYSVFHQIPIRSFCHYYDPWIKAKLAEKSSEPKSLISKKRILNTNRLKSMYFVGGGGGGGGGCHVRLYPLVS